MTPAARLQTSIHILLQILRQKTPADHLITAHFRDHRFIGSSDRREIAEQVYHILRNLGVLMWICSMKRPFHQNIDEAEIRKLLLAHLYHHQKQPIEKIQELFDGNRYHPRLLSPEELQLLMTWQMLPLDKESMPLHVKLNVPEWLLPKLQEALGNDFATELAALNQPASLDLRVNILKIQRDEVLTLLKKEGIAAEPTPWSPLGIRLEGRRPLSQHRLWQEGLIEVQDEGSQLVAAMVDTKAGMSVLDLCAGAGGKTLAMAAGMNNQGVIIAADVHDKRLERSRERLKRAGVFNVERRLILEKDDPWLAKQNKRFDRVLVDVPCSGVGTWRRNPDLKWKLTPEDLHELTTKQQGIMNIAAPLIKKGGRLIYATCSLLKEENEEQIETFLTSHPDFTSLPIQDVWQKVLSSPCPIKTPFLRLTPAQHQVDGFFAAILIKN